MGPSGSPTVRRRRLAAELRRLRGNTTGTVVSRAVGWSPTKISRAESGRESIPPQEVEKLLDYYRVTDPLRAQLLSLAEDATRRGWWEDYSGVLAGDYLEYIGLESEAVSAAVWHSDIVPGLLQTADYARQISVGYQSVIPTPPSVVEQVVQVRALRQERLTSEPALQLNAIIDEAVLMRRIGTRQLMQAQLAHLAAMSELPNIDLRILALDREGDLVAPPFEVLSFGQWEAASNANLGDVVYIETVRNELYIEGEMGTYPFRLFFQALTRAALSPEASRDLLRGMARSAVSEHNRP